MLRKGRRLTGTLVWTDRRDPAKMRKIGCSEKTEPPPASSSEKGRQLADHAVGIGEFPAGEVDGVTGHAVVLFSLSGRCPCRRALGSCGKSGRHSDSHRSS